MHLVGLKVSVSFSQFHIKSFISNLMCLIYNSTVQPCSFTSTWIENLADDKRINLSIVLQLRNATANHCNGNVNEENETPSVANVNETMIIHSKGNVDQETDCLTLITTEATTPPSHRRSSTPLTSRRYSCTSIIHIPIYQRQYTNLNLKIGTYLYWKL